jgi:hypothetical protein
VLAPAEPAPGFLPRYRLLASMEALSEHDTHFFWDADFGLAVDVVDFGRGRVHLAFAYETVLGDELQPFDPRQANYGVDVLGTWRRGPTEWGLLLHHVSRHLGDRTKRFGIAWNDLGVQVLHTRTSDRWTWQVRGRALGTVARGFVDYGGDLGGEAIVHRTASPRISAIGSLATHVRLVRGSALDRGAQVGARVEAGVRVEGIAAAVEIVGGAERRVDADPFEFAPRQWVFAGLRIVTR